MKLGHGIAVRVWVIQIKRIMRIVVSIFISFIFLSRMSALSVCCLFSALFSYFSGSANLEIEWLPMYEHLDSSAEAASLASNLTKWVR